MPEKTGTFTARKIIFNVESAIKRPLVVAPNANKPNIAAGTVKCLTGRHINKPAAPIIQTQDY